MIFDFSKLGFRHRGSGLENIKNSWNVMEFLSLLTVQWIYFLKNLYEVNDHITI